MYTWEIWSDGCLIMTSSGYTFDTEEDAVEDAESTIKSDMERLANDGVDISREDYEIEVVEVED